MKILYQFYPVSYYSVCAISFSPSHSASSPVAGPGARKPSVGEGKESSQPLVCSALVYFLFFSFFYISAPILACEIIIIIIIYTSFYIARGQARRTLCHTFSP